jgi:Na+/proline symporter
MGRKSTYGYWVFLCLAFFGLIVFGLFKMRREAAIAHFVVSLVAVFIVWGNTTKLLSAIVGVLTAILAIRGIYSYARLRGMADQAPPSNQRPEPDRESRN